MDICGHFKETALNLRAGPVPCWAEVVASSGKAGTCAAQHNVHRHRGSTELMVGLGRPDPTGRAAAGIAKEHFHVKVNHSSLRNTPAAVLA